MMRNVASATAAVALATIAVTTAPAEADRRGYYAPERGYVVARSDFGNGRVSGPVRETRLGPQVRLPGGNWIYCKQSCSETLRVNTVDFWHSQEGAGPDAATTHEGGIFGNLGILFGW